MIAADLDGVKIDEISTSNVMGRIIISSVFLEEVVFAARTASRSS
ncbi:MAG TPA: hypothetical protein VKA87_01850 [Nitrososphaeraceae archaeon]|nr:hypothetical protein [Nitrososphaeraceae archaeon]